MICTVICFFQYTQQMLPHGEQYPCDVGKRQENLPKNRFKTTFPCTLTNTFDMKKGLCIKTDFVDISEYIYADLKFSFFTLMYKLL